MITHAIRTGLRRLVEPHSRDEDLGRQEFIMNVLLLGSVLLAFCTLGLLTVDFLTLPPSKTAHAVSPFIVLGILVFFVSLYVLSRRGHHKVAAYLFLATWYFAATYTMYEWGAPGKEAWLIFGFIIVTSGVVLSFRTSIWTLALVAVTTGYVDHLQTVGIINPVITVGGTDETVIGVVTLGIITLVSWLSARDIHRALQRARTSEAALKIERDLLETRVDERTKELRRAQEEDFARLYRFAQFGRLTSGVLHDILNPLTAVSLNLEVLGKKGQSESLREAIENTRRIERFIEATRKEVQDQVEKTDFSVAEEIRQASDIVRYRANQANVSVRVSAANDVILHNSPVKFHQIISNLLSNAVDAYAELQSNHGDRLVTVTLERPSTARVRITVEDNAGGISPQNLPHIFEPLFTTKDIEHGTGLGLSVCKDLVEHDFGGTITVSSKVGHGSRFTVDIPSD